MRLPQRIDNITGWNLESRSLYAVIMRIVGRLNKSLVGVTPGQRTFEESTAAASYLVCQFVRHSGGQDLWRCRGHLARYCRGERFPQRRVRRGRVGALNSRGDLRECGRGGREICPGAVASLDDVDEGLAHALRLGR